MVPLAAPWGVVVGQQLVATGPLAIAATCAKRSRAGERVDCAGVHDRAPRPDHLTAPCGPLYRDEPPRELADSRVTGAALAEGERLLLVLVAKL